MMAEATPEPQPNGEPVQNLLQIWAESFSQVLSQIAGSSLPCQVSPTAPPGLSPAAEDDLWVLATASGGLRGEMCLRLPAATVLRLAQTFMSEPLAPEAALTPDHREAVIELLRQISGIVTSASKARWGEIQLLIELAAAPPSWPPAETLWLQAGGEGADGMVLEFGLSAALVAELRAPRNEAAVAGTNAAERVSPPQSSAAPTYDPAAPAALSLLMDVPLTVSMRFGSRRLLLSEVLDLSPGAVIELDRQVQEPVDLLLDGRLVAHGEVVVIDGNYGLRVTDVFPSSQPLFGRSV
jgi:flagellar motor switch protein FliN/FliY